MPGIARIRLVLLVLFGLAVILFVGAGARLLAAPAGLPAGAPDPAAGLRAQQQIAQLLLREAGLSTRAEPIAVTGEEISALLTRHLRPERTGVWPVLVQIRPPLVEIVGRSSLRVVAARTGDGWPATLLPDLLLDRPLWLRIGGTPEVRQGAGRLRVEAASVGRQEVSPAMVWRLLGRPAEEVLTWRTPRVVTRITLEPDRILLHTAP